MQSVSCKCSQKKYIFSTLDYEFGSIRDCKAHFGRVSDLDYVFEIQSDAGN